MAELAALPSSKDALAVSNDTCVKRMVQAMKKVMPESDGTPEQQRLEWRLQFEIRAGLEEHIRAYEERKQEEMSHFADLLAAKYESQANCRTRRHALQQRHSIGVFAGQENIIAQPLTNKKSDEDLFRAFAEQRREAEARLEEERRKLQLQARDLAKREEQVVAESRTVDEIRIDLEVEKDRMVDAQRLQEHQFQEELAARERSLCLREEALRRQEGKVEAQVSSLTASEGAMQAQRALLVAERREAGQEQGQLAEELQREREALAQARAQLAEEERAMSDREADIAARRRSLEGEALRQKELAEHRRSEVVADRRASELSLREEHQRMLEQKGEIEQEHSKLQEQRRELEQELVERVAAAEAREAEVEAREAAAAALQLEQAQDRERLEEQRCDLRVRAEAFQQQEQAFRNEQEQLDARREQQFGGLAELDQQREHLEIWQKELEDKADKVERSRAEALEMSSTATALEQAITTRERIVEESEVGLRDRERALAETQRELARREETVAVAEETSQAEHQGRREILAKLEQIEGWKADLASKEKELANQEKDLKQRDRDLHTKELSEKLTNEAKTVELERRFKDREKFLKLRERQLEEQERRAEELEAAALVAATPPATPAGAAWVAPASVEELLSQEREVEEVEAQLARWEQQAARARPQEGGFAALVDCAEFEDAGADFGPTFTAASSSDAAGLGGSSAHAAHGPPVDLARPYESDQEAEFFAAISASSAAPVARRKRLKSRKALPTPATSSADAMEDDQPSPKAAKYMQELRGDADGLSMATSVSEPTPSAAQRLIAGVSSIVWGK